MTIHILAVTHSGDDYTDSGDNTLRGMTINILAVTYPGDENTDSGGKAQHSGNDYTDSGGNDYTSESIGCDSPRTTTPELGYVNSIFKCVLNYDIPCVR